MKDFTKEDKKLLVSIIRQLKIALSNMRLYPLESEVVQTSLKNLFNSITTFLDTHNYLVLGFIEGKPIVNKVDISMGMTERIDGGVFLRSLNEHNIKTVTFRKGLKFWELETFLKYLRDKYDAKNLIKDKLSEVGVKRIGVNEKIYKAIGDSDLVIERGKEILSKSRGALDDVLAQVEKIVEMTVSIEDPTLREKLKLEIGKKLLFKDPTLLEKILGKDKRGGGIYEEVSREEVEELLSELIEIFRALKNGKINEAKDRLKEAIRNVISILEKIDPTYLLSEGIFLNIEELESFFKKWRKVSLKETSQEEEDVAKSLLNETTFNLVREKKVSEVIKELCEKGKWQSAFALIKKIVVAFDSLNPSVRAKALSRINESLEEIFINAKPKEFYFLYLRVIKVFIKETSQEVFDELLKLLPSLTQKAYVRGLYNEIIKLLAFINSEIHSDKTPKSRLRMVVSLKGDIKEQLKDLLLESIEKKERVDRFTLKIVYYFGEEIVSYLVKRLKEVEDSNVIKNITQVIVAIGYAAEQVVLSEIELETDSTKLRRLLPIVDKFKDREGVINALKTVLRTSPLHIRPLIFKKLVDLSAGGLVEFAMEFLESNDPEHQLIGLEYLLKNSPDKVRERVKRLLIPRKVLFLKFSQGSYVKVKRRVIELIGEEELLWGIPYVIPQLAHQDRHIKKAAFNTLKSFKPEIIKPYKKELEQVGKSKDPITREYVKSLLEYIE